MLDGVILACRIVQLIFALVVLGTGAYVISLFTQTYTDYLGYSYTGWTPSQLAYILFCAVWTLLVVAYQVFVPRFNETLGHKFVILGIDGLTTVLWFAGFIALAVFTGVATDVALPAWYRTLQACVAFSAFTWVAFVVTTVLNFLSVFRGNTSNKHRGGGTEFQANP